MKTKTIILSALAMTTLHVSAQQISAKHEVIDCGNVAYENPVTVKFELKNSGHNALQINKVRTSCGCTSVDYPKNSIPAGDSFTLSATYDAQQMGHFLKDIGIYSNASDKPFFLSIRGVVVEEVVDFSGNYPYTLADIRSDLNNIEFDDVNRGDRPMQKIHIMNNSSQPLSPTAMHLPAYLSANVSPTTIMPGRQGTISIILDSKKLRDYGLTQTSVYLGMFPGDKVSPEKEIPVSAVLLPAFTEMTETQLANAPQVRLSEENLHFKMNGKSKKTESITIENVGRSDLDISSLQMFTTGLKVKLNKTRLLPNETATLKITVDSKALRGARTKPRVLMITNDPEKSKVVINIDVN